MSEATTKGADRSRRPPMLDIEIPVLTYSTVTVLPSVTGSPVEPERPRVVPPSGASPCAMFTPNKVQKWARARVVTCAICGDDGKEKALRVVGPGAR